MTIFIVLFKLIACAAIGVIVGVLLARKIAAKRRADMHIMTEARRQAFKLQSGAVLEPGERASQKRQGERDWIGGSK